MFANVDADQLNGFDFEKKIKIKKEIYGFKRIGANVPLVVHMDFLLNVIDTLKRKGRRAVTTSPSILK